MEDYIPYLRKKIGHEPCLTVGLSALAVDPAGRILIEKRRDNGLYCLPGGSIDYEEKVLDGLKREIKEETGISLQNATLFMVQSGQRMTLRYPNGDVTSYVVLTFYCPLDQGAAIIKPHDEESTEVFFCPVAELPDEKLFLPGDVLVLQKYFRKDFSVAVN
jgi:8-oxo-dGTP pyrophosphatase MutT (NUDIX family)